MQFSHRNNGIRRAGPSGLGSYCHAYHALTNVAIYCRRFAPLSAAYPEEARDLRVINGPASKRRHSSSHARKRVAFTARTPSAEDI
jgi:hypothetical protein